MFSVPRSLLKTSAKFVRILEQVTTLDCVSGFHWCALEFSQTFTSVFNRLWRHGKHVLFLKWMKGGCNTCKSTLSANQYEQELRKNQQPQTGCFVQFVIRQCGVACREEKSRPKTSCLFFLNWKRNSTDSHIKSLHWQVKLWIEKIKQSCRNSRHQTMFKRNGISDLKRPSVSNIWI